MSTERLLSRPAGTYAPRMVPPRKRKSDATPKSRALADGRVQMLVYLPPSLVKAIKRHALEADTSASAVVEAAVDAWLRRNGQATT